MCSHFLMIFMGNNLLLRSQIKTDAKAVKNTAVQEKNIKKQKNSLAEKTRNHQKEKPLRKEKCRKERTKHAETNKLFFLEETCHHAVTFFLIIGFT